jgi:hypothetical protein
MLVFDFDTARAGTKQPSDHAVIFLGLEIPDAAMIEDAFVRWTDAHVPPPVTVIIGQGDEMQKFYSSEMGHGARLRGLDKLYRHGQVVLCGFDYSGRVSRIDNSEGVVGDYTDFLTVAIRAYIGQQIEENDVVIPAPPSIYFDKLSTRYSSHFIRAEALLQSTIIIELIALALLKPLNDWYSQSIISASENITIYLDTMGIWPVAEKLTQLHQVKNPVKLSYAIESFKSYDGLTTWDPPRRPAFVVISATTSGGLAEKVRAKLGATTAQTWTLITLAPLGKGEPEKGAEDSKQYVYQLSRQLIGRPALNGLRTEFQTDITTIPPGAETISIVSERFLSQPVKPKRVRLTHKAQDSEIKAALTVLATKRAVKAARGRFDARSRWSVTFDFDALIQLACDAPEEGGDSLLKSWLRNYSSPSPVAIVYPSGEGTAAQGVTEASVTLAERTKTTLAEISPDVQAFVLSSDELLKPSNSHPVDLKSCSLIVVSPVIGNGFVFKQISALLRHKQPKGPRLFLTLAVLPESQAHLGQLRQDITLQEDDRKYEFRSQFAIPIGRLDSAVQWDQELEVLQTLDERLRKAGINAPIVCMRTELLQGLEMLPDQGVFLPSASEEPLLLSSGFFLWNDSTKIEGGEYGAAVLLTAAALLQAARTGATKVDDTSLRTGLFQHALICPETFTRFNDAVIQAAFLRAAYPAELNYSVSPEMSGDMTRLLLKWIKYADQPAGAAAGEFLLAIALGKLKLRKDDMASVLQAAKEQLGWLGVLGSVAETRVVKGA